MSNSITASSIQSLPESMNSDIREVGSYLDSDGRHQRPPLPSEKERNCQIACALLMTGANTFLRLTVK